MSDPRHSHEYQPTRKGRCGRIVGTSICALPEEAPVHRQTIPLDLDDLARETAEKLYPVTLTTANGNPGSPEAWKLVEDRAAANVAFATPIIRAALEQARKGR